MSRQLVSREQLQRYAAQRHTWHDAAAKAPQIAALFGPQSLEFRTLDKRLVLGDEALRVLCALNDFDRRKVAEELLEVARHPNRLDADTGRKNWFQRLLPSRYPFRGYHYLIRYAITPGQPVAVVDIYMDTNLVGAPNSPDAMQRNVMYRVDKVGTARFTPRFKELGDSSEKVIRQLRASWKTTAPIPIHRIETQHAAVNGMLNDLDKAAWLMGAHLETAYAAGTQGIDNYTLFHNPTDGFAKDLVECGFDKQNKLGRSSCSRHLAAVLKEAQGRGHRTRWVAHSQGVIILTAAVEFVLQHYGMRLDCHSVCLHGSGADVALAKQICARAGIVVENVLNNPFDPVANICGHVDRSGSGLARSLKFMSLVKGGDSLASSHTLPYLGLETYVEQLRFTGNHELARYAQQFHPSEMA